MTKKARICIGEKGSMYLQQMMLGKLNTYMQRRKPDPFVTTYTHTHTHTHTHKLKMDYEPKWEIWNHKNPRRDSTGSNSSHMGHSNFFLNMSPQARGIKNKSKNKLLRLYQNKKLLQSKGNSQKKAMYWNDICKWYIWYTKYIKNLYNWIPKTR